MSKDRNHRADRIANRRMEQAKIRRDRYGDDVQQHQRQKRSKPLHIVGNDGGLCLEPSY